MLSGAFTLTLGSCRVDWRPGDGQRTTTSRRPSLHDIGRLGPPAARRRTFDLSRVLHESLMMEKDSEHALNNPELSWLLMWEAFTHIPSVGVRYKNAAQPDREREPESGGIRALASMR